MSGSSGLFVRRGDYTYKIRLAADQGAGPKVRINGVTYNICLVEENDPLASPLRIRTSTGTKAAQSDSFTITASVSGGGGSINPGGSVIVDRGTDRSFTIATDSSCYKITDIIIDGSDPINAIHLYEQTSPYVYTFENVQTNHTIAATFALGAPGYAPVMLSYTNVAQTGVPVQFVIDGTSINTNNTACLSVGNHSVYATPTIQDSYFYYALDSFVLLESDGTSVTFNNFTCNPTIIPVSTSPRFLQAHYTSVATILENPNFTYHTLTASSGPNGSIYPASASILHGTCATFLLTPNSGYHLASLTLNGNPVTSSVSNNQYTVSNIAVDTQIAATFSVIQHTITASVSGGGGSIDPSGAVTVDHGSSRTFTLTPNTGYQLTGLTYGGDNILSNVANNQVTIDNVTADAALTASFSPLYTITASAGSGGSISPSGAVTVVQGGSRTFTLTPNTGYHLSGLVRSDIGSVLSSVVNNQYTASNVNANFSLTASFSNQYKITASAGYGGSISPSGQVYVNPGSTPTFYITADDYFQISVVYVNGSYIGQVNSYKFPSVQTDNQTISATFEVNCQECYECYLACQTCQDTCQINCQTGCEISCQTGCEVSCQTGCQVSCQTTCELACQTGCEVSCQTGCEVTCQTGCQVSCQTGCEVSCQTGCEVSCQAGCEVACQSGCEVSCQSCNTCQTCQLGCQEGCQVSCQTDCQVSCQGCQGCNTCQDACQSLCQSCYICQPVCNWCQNCMIGY